VVTSDQGQLLIVNKVLTFSLNFDVFSLVRWNSRGSLRHNECAV